MDLSGTTFFRQSDQTGIVIFLIAVAIFVIIMIAVNIAKKRFNIPAISGAGITSSVARHYSGFTLHRLAAGMGLSREQVHMLDYVFKHDSVADPARSINSPALLDKHFEKAFRLIEHSSGTEDEAQARLSVLFSTRNALESGSTADSATSTRQIPENASAVLNVGKESYPVKIISSKGEHLVVENPHKAMGTPIQIPRGSKVILSFFTRSSKGFSFESRVLGMSESSGGALLQLMHSSQMKQLSKRRFRRRHLVLAASFYLVRMEEAGRQKAAKMVVDKRRITGNIMDISIGGCSVKTNAAVPTGARLKIETSPEGNNIAVLGQVLRTNRTGLNTIMHIKFLRVPVRSLNLINALVYEYIDG
jgi:hypothetical protein